jgi:hypothetical protein
MRKINFHLKTFNCSRFFLWRCGLVAFLLIFVVILLINIFLFWRIKKELAASISDDHYAHVTIKREVLNQALSEMKNRKEIFDKTFTERIVIKDPSI